MPQGLNVRASPAGRQGGAADPR